MLMVLLNHVTVSQSPKQVIVNTWVQFVTELVNIHACMNAYVHTHKVMLKLLSADNVNYLKITFVQSEFSPYDTLFNSMITSIKS